MILKVEASWEHEVPFVVGGGLPFLLMLMTMVFTMMMMMMMVTVISVVVLSLC